MLRAEHGLVERLIRLDITDLATGCHETQSFLQQAGQNEPLDPKIASAMAGAAHIIKGFQILPRFPT